MKTMQNVENILTYIATALGIHRVPTILAGVTLSVLVTLASSSPVAAAEPAQTYHGTITSGEFLCDMTPVPGPTVTGNWNVNIDPATPAQVTLNVFYDGSHHLAFGYNALMLVSYQAASMCSGPGRRDGDARYEYDSGDVLLARPIQRLLAPSAPITSLSYLGVASRGGG